MNDYTNIKWITIVIPVVTLSIVEFLRLSFLSNTFSITSSIFLLIFFAVGGFSFSQAIFKYIQQKNDEIYWERHRLQALFEHTSDGIIVIDENRNVIEINPAAEKMTGWKANEVIGKVKCCHLNGCFDMSTCESDGQDTCFNFECGSSKCWGLTCFKEQSCIPYVEMCINRKDGIKIPVAASYSYIPAFGDEKPHIKMVLRDISSRKELERAVQTVAVLEERYRISREMHDGLAQDLCLLSLKLKTMRKTMVNTNDELTKNELEMMNCIINNALAEVRQTIFDLKVNPQQLACFTSWVRESLKDFRTKNGITTILECDLSNKVMFPNEVRIQLARIVQESLNNIRKHAQATEVRVKMYKNNKSVVIHIEDNGIGFDQEQNIDLTDHFGLSIMKERAQLMNGTINIESKQHQGTKIKISVPYDELVPKVS